MTTYKHWLRHLPLIIGLILALAIAVAVYYLQDMFQKPAQPKKQMQQITMIQPPPPPPPPPEVKPPEPEPEPEKLPEPEPEPEPTPEPEPEQPAGEELGVDAEGGAGADGFGLIGKKGGRGLLGGSGGSAILWYGGQVKRGLEDALQNKLADSSARASAYTAQLNIWIAADGSVSRAELATSSGKADVDQALRAALPTLRFSLPKPPPANMPQPLKIRVTSRI